MLASHGSICVRRATVAGLVLLATCTLGSATEVDDARPESGKLVIRGAEIGPPVTPFVIDIDVRDLPRAPEWKPGDPVRECLI